MPTPHINAQKNDFAKTVLMPGDPLRAQHIAENFLKNPQQVNNVRNMLAFTGEYNGKKISVMGSGMGIPSCSIYTKELITEYGVQNIIRVGTCGGIHKDLNLRDLIIATSASTDSNVNRARLMGYDYAATADFDLLEKAVNTAKKLNIAHRVGTIFTADLFYSPQPKLFDAMERMGILGVEMETAGLYGCAAEYGAKALTILTVSDHIRRHESTSPHERQTSFNHMMKLALEAFSDL